MFEASSSFKPEYVGEGDNREVYSYKGLIIKIGKYDFGCFDNMIEFELLQRAKSKGYSNRLMDIYHCSDNGKFLICEKLELIEDDMHFVYKPYKDKLKEFLSSIPDELIEIINDDAGDWLETRNLGIDNFGNIKSLDYSFCDDIQLDKPYTPVDVTRRMAYGFLNEAKVLIDSGKFSNTGR